MVVYQSVEFRKRLRKWSEKWSDQITFKIWDLIWSKITFLPKWSWYDLISGKLSSETSSKASCRKSYWLSSDEMFCGVSSRAREWSVNCNNHKQTSKCLFLRQPKTNYFKLVDNCTKPQVKIDQIQLTHNRTITALFEPTKSTFLWLYC